MPAQWLPLLTISLVIITNNVRITYSECYITKEISEVRDSFTSCIYSLFINLQKVFTFVFIQYFPFEIVNSLIFQFRMKYPEFNDCLTLTEVDCSKGK